MKNYHEKILIEGKVVSDIEVKPPKASGKYKSIFDIELSSDNKITCVYWGTSTMNKNDNVRLKGWKTDTIFIVDKITIIDGAT